jgi:hypothetical protein
LGGGVQQTVAALEEAARAAGLRGAQRKGIDEAVNYLSGKAEHLRYDTALERGWPIATGIIEGAWCATRRAAVSPAQPGGTRREVLGSDDLPGVER